MEEKNSHMKTKGNFGSDRHVYYLECGDDYMCTYISQITILCMLIICSHFNTSWSEVKSLSRVRLFETPWIIAPQAPRSMGFFRQEYWSGLPFPFPGDLPDPGIEPRSPALQADAQVSRIAGRRFNLWATREATKLEGKVFFLGQQRLFQKQCITFFCSLTLQSDTVSYTSQTAIQEIIKFIQKYKCKEHTSFASD